MLNYTGTGRMDYEDVLRAIGHFIDEHNFKEVCIIELEEGWHMLSNIIDCPVEDVKVGMPVEVVFQKESEEITLPRFRPRS